MSRLFISLFLLVATLCGCTPRQSYRQCSGAAWGTTYHITYRADRDLSDTIIATIAAVDRSLSAFNPASLLSAVNRGETCTVDSMFACVYLESATVNRLSGGRFDPTVGPLVNLWGFGPDGNLPSPDSATVAAVLCRVGLGKTALNGDTLVCSVDSMKFDFAAIAKGYGVDCVAGALAACGATDMMVEIGGEIRCLGLNPSGKPWRIQIDSPAAEQPGRDALCVISPGDRGVATSGNYRNFRVRPDGSRYGHTIDPLTGYPARRPTLSATVIAPTCLRADALATAAMAMQPDSAIAMLRSLPEVDYILLVARGDSTATLSSFKIN